MNRLSSLCRIAGAVCLLTAHAATISAQEPAPTQRAADLRSAVDRLRAFATVAEPIVRDEPYSAVGATTTTQVLADGTRIERTATTRVWRDRQGRVRREQTAVGFDWLNASNDAVAVVTITDPVANVTYTLDAANRTARSAPLSRRRIFAPTAPPAAASESLGTRDIQGLKATGTRTTTTIPIGQIGNDRPIAATDERWESPELQVLLHSRQSDPRTGIVEYRLTNISRAEPPADLFVVPSGYNVINQPTFFLRQPDGTAPAGGGARGRGRSNLLEQFAPPQGN
jgi:hypothetical protein